jgi:hypothetical protein
MKLKIKKTEDKNELDRWIVEQSNKLKKPDEPKKEEPVINKDPTIETKSIKDNEMYYRFCCPCCGEEISLEGKFYKTNK